MNRHRVVCHDDGRSPLGARNVALSNATGLIVTSERAVVTGGAPARLWREGRSVWVAPGEIVRGVQISAA